MKVLHKFLFIVALLLGIVYQSSATHYRAGEITFENTGNYRYIARCTTYAKWSTPSDLADRDSLEILWGDGSSSIILRSNGPDITSPFGGGPNNIPDGELFAANDIRMNVYVGIHQYSGAPPPPNRYYVISVQDLNRMDGINNITNSVNVPFFVEDTIKFPNNDANIGLNSSPILLNMPIDYANVNDTFYHNPNAYDPNAGDSIDFQLITPLQDHTIPVPGYRYPQVVCPDRSFTLNNRTGEIIWATPCQQGIFNIAILIRDFRNGVNLSTMIRDMQIIVGIENNDPPQIADIIDTCIRAGDVLVIPVRATDPNPGDIVTLTANGGPMQQAISPATFTATQGNPATGTFTWGTVCDHILGQDYTVVFKAQDNHLSGGFTSRPLVDLETWRIKVIPPPVEGLTAVATPNSVVLNWQNPYSCANSADFRGFSVWRKVGCDSFVPNYCENDLSLHGYIKITTNNVTTYTYTDITTLVGQQYSYRIVAHFSKVTPNGLFFYDAIAGVPSDEVCVAMPISVPVMINVDVTQTDAAAGQIFVRWTKPVAGGNNLDTVQFAPPYTFNLYRGTGFNFDNPVRINTFTAPSFSALNDTSFTDTGLNTQDNPYSYRVSFLSTPDSIGITSIASSVYLDVLSSDQSLNLVWNENVPWTNDSFAVFRLNNLTSVYDSIGVAYNHTYADTGLINDSTYCYYVKAYGHYEVAVLPRPLINRSQRDCGIPVDTVPPCPPILAVRNECDQYNNLPWQTNSYTNFLNWNITAEPCNDDITRYYIYYGADSASMVLVDSTMSKGDTSYNHILNDNLAGCYAVTALDRIGNESALSNVFCIDNCPYYILPNTFTPNGDGQNDVFHPFIPYRFVPKIQMRIFNRWGEEVFRTEDPFIGWDGNDSKGKPVSEGVYLYAGYYYEQRLGGLVEKPLSGEKKGGGVIHLIRGK